jgi:hypothetical protein
MASNTARLRNTHLHQVAIFLILGLLLNPETTWICFHGGFDFAYFMKTVSGDQYLPDFEDTFME